RGLCSRDSSFRERPRQEWIEIPVPALVSEATFALAQEQFEKNKRFSPRRTLEPSLLQGLLVCQRCGYGLYRASTRTSQRTIHYYRCLGRDGYRHLKGAVCDNQPIRQEQLDAVVWQEIVRLLEDPSLLQAELDRRLQAAQTTDPLKRREDALRRDQARLSKSMERLLTGYQENLITLEELRCRMPELRKQQRANETELQSLEMTAVDPTRNLRLVETLAEFRTRLPEATSWKWQSVRESYGCWCRRSWWAGTTSQSAIPFPCQLLRPTRTMEFGQAVNRPSPIPAHVTFCVQTVYAPATMSPNSACRGVRLPRRG